MRRCSKQRAGRGRPRAEATQPRMRSPRRGRPAKSRPAARSSSFTDRALSALGLEEHLAVLSRTTTPTTRTGTWSFARCTPIRGRRPRSATPACGCRRSPTSGHASHGGIVIGNRVRRRQEREHHADAIAGRMSDFPPDRSAATPQAKAGQRAAALAAALRPARPPASCTRCRPPNGRGAPADDLEPMSSATTGRRSTNRNGRRARRGGGRGPSGRLPATPTRHPTARLFRPAAAVNYRVGYDLGVLDLADRHQRGNRPVCWLPARIDRAAPAALPASVRRRLA